jgi:hypothetical protein
MLGAIAGDVIGSVYEASPVKTANGQEVSDNRTVCPGRDSESVCLRSTGRAGAGQALRGRGSDPSESFMIIRGSINGRYHPPCEGGFKEGLHVEPSLRILVHPTVRYRKRVVQPASPGFEQKAGMFHEVGSAVDLSACGPGQLTEPGLSGLAAHQVVVQDQGIYALGQTHGIAPGIRKRGLFEALQIEWRPRSEHNIRLPLKNCFHHR